MSNALLWSLICSALHNRHIQWSFDGQPHVRGQPVSATPHGYRQVQNYATCTGAPATDVASIGAATFVSCFGRIYSHLEVLTQGNRNVFINTPNADIVMCIIIYEYTARCVHIELCRYFIYSATWRICSSPLLIRPPRHQPPGLYGHNLIAIAFPNTHYLS